MANCANCSAPLPQNSIKCDYCGSRNDVDLKGVHYYTTHDPDSERNCPRCGIALRTIDLKLEGKFLIERCEQCLGLFFDHGELEALLDATVTKVFAVNSARLERINVAGSKEHAVSYVKCPVCGNFMNRVNFGAKSGVIVDRCREHGSWLDGGELRQLCEWTKAGGKILDQQRREQKEKEAAQEERQRRRSAAGAAGADFESAAGYDMNLSRGERDVCDLLLDALGGLFR